MEEEEEGKGGRTAPKEREKGVVLKKGREEMGASQRPSLSTVIN